MCMLRCTIFFTATRIDSNRGDELSQISSGSNPFKILSILFFLFSFSLLFCPLPFAWIVWDHSNLFQWQPTPRLVILSFTEEDIAVSKIIVKILKNFFFIFKSKFRAT